MYKKTCINCGEEFLIKKYSEYKRESRKCCCYKCATIIKNKNRAIYKYPIKTGNCKYCGKELIANTYNELRKVFCGRACKIPYDNKNRVWTKESREKQSKAQKKRVFAPQSRESIEKRAKSIMGENHWNWQGGKTPEQTTVRNRASYKEWRTSVFERDNYTCKKCGDRSREGNRVELNAHHIKEFSKHKELRLDTENGITLCISCHREVHFGKKIKSPIYPKDIKLFI